MAVIREIAAITGIDVRIETEAYGEGGLRERFKLITKNKFVLASLMAIITGVVTVPGDMFRHLLTHDQETEELEKQKLQNEVEQGKLNIEKTKTEVERNKLDIERIRRNMQRFEREANEANRVSAAIDVTRTVSFINDTSYKILRHKSNFYRLLHTYPKVTHITFTRLSTDNRETSAPAVVFKQEFPHFVLSSDVLKPVRDEEAVLEIIFPVLKPGNYKWKGIYLKTGESIDFYMRDQKYKDEVVQAKILFRNGSRISCVLDISRKLTETGDATVSSYTVVVVTGSLEGNITTETLHGREYRLAKNQLALPFA